MTPDEFRAARLKLKLTPADCAMLFSTDERTVRGWEKGFRNGRPQLVAPMAGLLMRLMLKFAAVRRELGLHERTGLNEQQIGAVKQARRRARP